MIKFLNRTPNAPTSQLCKGLNGDFNIIDLFVYLMGPTQPKIERCLQ